MANAFTIPDSNGNPATTVSATGVETTGILEVGGASYLQGAAHLNGGTNTAGASTASTPTISTGSSTQLSTVQDTMLYANITTAATFSLAIGLLSSSLTTIVTSATATTKTLFTVRVPAVWFVKSTFTSADVTWTAVTC